MMNLFLRIGFTLVLSVPGAFSLTISAVSQTQTVATAADRDGQHDFDFNIGDWRTHIKRLDWAATGARSWVTLEGTVKVRKVWGGRGELEEIKADGANVHVEGLTTFLYNPQTRQWSQTFAGIEDGTFEPSMIGEFKNGRGELVSQTSFHGKIRLVRGVWSEITADAHKFEEDYSDDGGKTWEPTFIASLTRDKS
jgi:hypothetical protein